MAPVTVTATGVGGERIEDPQLRALLDRLCTFKVETNALEEGTNEASNDDSDHKMQSPSRVDVEGLVGELERWPKWRFHEQVRCFFVIGDSFLHICPYFLIVCDCFPSGSFIRLDCPTQCH